MSRNCVCFFAFPALFLALASARAAVPVVSLPVENAGFEDPALGAGVWRDGVPPGWTFTDMFSPSTFTEHITGFASEGVNHQGLFSGIGIWQELPVSWAPNTAYTLIAGVGNRNIIHTATGNQSTLYLESGSPDAPDVLAAASMDASLLPALSFSDFTLAFTTGASAPDGPIRIRLSAEGNARSHFDNVRLTAQAVPEPSAALLLAGAALVFRDRRNRR